jgi:two-component system chemotaxis response regulator CheY
MDQPLQVLIVDDHGPTRALLRAFIRAEGWSVVGEAASAEDGFKALRQLGPDVVCLDVVMPGISGTEILKRMKTDFPRTAVIMVTASATPDVVKMALDGGADGFLVKPFERERIVQTLRAAIKKVAGKAAP